MMIIIIVSKIYQDHKYIMFEGTNILDGIPHSVVHVLCTYGIIMRSD